jgi:AcrR family transcriptional regulator
MPDVNPAYPRQASLRQERAEATRQRIADAARRRFSRDGYSAVTIRDIAVEAGVAVQTVYAVYGSKAGILAALRAAAMHQPDAVAAFAAAMASPSLDERLRGFASSIRLRWERAGDIVLIHRDAAAADRLVRAGVEQTLAVRREGIAALARSLAPGLRAGTSVGRAAAILDALSLPEVYFELTAVAAWSPEAFETWLGDSLVDLLLAQGGRAR